VAPTGELANRDHLDGLPVASDHDDVSDIMSQASAWLLQASIPTVHIFNAFTGRPFD